MSWRLLLDGAADGATNLAVDSVILEAVSERLAPATLRLYRWAPPCLSIGAFQAVARALAQPAGTPGRDWVRRPTGGRALLHDHELTYAVIAPVDDPLVVGGVAAAAQRIAAALAAGLDQLGVPDLAVAPARRRLPRPSGPACYDTASGFEITAGGRKLVGSAQLRRANAVLQHGSLLLSFDRRALAERLAVPDREALVAALAAAATALDELLPLPPLEAIARALVAGFRAAVGPLPRGTLTASERERLPSRIAFYRSPAWNCRR